MEQGHREGGVYIREYFDTIANRVERSKNEVTPHEVRRIHIQVAQRGVAKK